MRRYPVLILLLIILAGYFGYRCSNPGPPEVWKYIPGSASVVISSDRLQHTFDPAYPAEDTLDENYLDLPLVSLAAGTLSVIRWFNQDQDQIAAFLKDKTITYAFYPLAGNSLGIVMYVPVHNELEEKWLGNPKAGSLRVSSHSFQGYSVTDISNERSEKLFSYIIQDRFLIISQYGELIEDVVRNAKSGSSGQQSNYEKVERIPEGEHHLSIYTSGKAWRNFFLPPALDPGVSAFLDIIPDHQGFHLKSGAPSGQLLWYSKNAEISENLYDPLIKDQDGTPFTATDYISQQTTYMIRMAVSNESKFRSSYTKWLKKRRTLPSLTALDHASGDRKDDFYREIGPEVILCVNESSGGISDSRVLLIRYENFDKAKPLLEKWVAATNPAGTRTAGFQGYEIYPVSIPNLTEGLFGPLFTGFKKSYITYLAPYLVIGNNALSVRNYLVDYENQLTWTHAPDFDSLSVYSGNNAQLSLITNMNKARAGLKSTRTGLTTSVDKIATTTLSYRKHGKYANLNLEINYSKGSKTRNQTALKSEFEWTDDFPPFFSAMVNPADGTSEILLTNKDHELLELTSNPARPPKILALLDGPATGRVYKADFLNIGRTQKIVSTRSSVYVVDEDEHELTTLLSDPAPTVINSMYRMNESRESGAGFIIKGNDHNLYVWERVHKSPFKLNTGVSFENILAPVVSFTRGNSNLYIVTQANGKVFALDEKGKVLKGFPVDMLSRIGGAFTASQNSADDQIEILGVTRQGEFFKIGSEGQILMRKQLLLPEPGSVFRTLYDENSLDWLLLRQTSGKAAILNKEGKEIFEIVNLKSDFSIRYHFFGSDNRFISVVSGGYISIFDFEGNRIGDTPIPCAGALGIAYHGARKELNIVSQNAAKVQIWSVKL